MEPEDGRISVWVCREEKLLSGLTKRTTCGDLVKVLLQDQNLLQAGMLSGAPHSYCVVEKWRGFERILPHKTRILRLWSAWGAEQDNVRFVLLKNDASLPNDGPRSAEARVVPSRDGGGPGALLKGTGRNCWTTAASRTQEKHRRVVRKAFRKLDKMNRKKEQSASRETGSVDRMETLVHLVLSQDHTIRQQLHRIRQLDREIERYEAGVHLDRIRTHGANYVQDTYLVDSSCCSSTSQERQDAPCAAGALAQFEEYARCCEEVVMLQEELTEREALVESVTGDIQEELNRRWMKRRGEDRAAAEPDVGSVSEEELLLQEQRVRTQLDTSLYVGLRLQTDLDALRGDLDLSLALWETRESELLDLLAQVETMQLQQGEPGGGWVEQTKACCTTTDEDSDTGLSSMTSQDSDTPPVCESLV